MAGYPDETDLSAYLTAMGFTIPAGLDLGAAINGAIADWERDSGWRPFLSSGEDEERKFETPIDMRMRLQFDSGLLTVTSVKTGVTYSSPGQTLTQNIDFFLYPTNAAYQEYPYTFLAFYRWPFGLPFLLRDWPQNIHITGTWGRVSSLPQNVFNAVLYKAVERLIPLFAIAITGGVTQIKLGNDTFAFNGNAFGAQAQMLKANYGQALKQYQRKRAI